MTVQLQSWCQHEVEKLLKQKEILVKKAGLGDSSDSPELPHYKTMLQLFRNIEEKELFLLEINDEIRTLERNAEMDKLKSAFSSIRLGNAYSKETSKSSIREWLKQILFHNKQSDNNEIIKEPQGNKFYDVEFRANDEKEFLTWSTLYRGRCTRLTVSACVDCKSCDPEDYGFSSSFYVNGLVSKGKKYISSGKKADEYVSEVLWKGLQELIDIS